ncbi:PepSY domain-containing protein [Muriicola sp. E247]|uniref:PepSY domain-containing protein n=1 Tax=Muriicola sp. E247 TaxID=3242730 RepID=UPI003526A91A
MVKRKTTRKFRKLHRYLGIILGIQFFMWTVSGIYFSWTDIDEIHGDHFRKENHTPMAFEQLVNPVSPGDIKGISSLELREIAGRPYYWINDSYLMDAETGNRKGKVTQEEALQIAGNYMLPELEVRSIELLEEAGSHHEYRGKPLPAFVITYDTPKNVRAYVSIADGSFQTVRYRDWRWFDFLWMMHTMDYEGRDDFNTLLLRVFSLFGLVTILSGFTLFYLTSPTLQKRERKKN